MGPPGTPAQNSLKTPATPQDRKPDLVTAAHKAFQDPTPTDLEGFVLALPLRLWR